MTYRKIRIAGRIKESIVDGPGIRYVVFGQGCPHKCLGCHNPETHDFFGGKLIKIENIINEIKKDSLLSGVTFSGGEPFCQPEAFYLLAREVIKLRRNLNITIYTGYEYEFLFQLSYKNQIVNNLLNIADILVDGKFDITKKDKTLRFRGSSNQRIIDLKKSLGSPTPVLYE